MGVEILSQKGRLYKDANELLRYRIEVPIIEGREEINSLYREILKNCESFCKGELYNKLSEMHSGQNKGYVYTMSAKLSACEDGFVSIRMFVRLKNSDGMVFEYEREDVWRENDCMLMPPKLLTKKNKKRDITVRR